MVAVKPRTPRAGRQPRAADLRPISLEGASLSDRGQVRDINEDSVHLEPSSSLEARTRGVLCVLADGMGGYAAGEVASRLAVQGIRSRYYSSPSTYIVDALRGAVEAANCDIWQQGQQQAEKSGMGCTLTAAVVMGDNLVVGHVGDSRAYLVRGRGIAQITEDHSWVAEQVAAGAMTPEQASNHPQRNVILRALGARSTVDVSVYQEKVLPGDALVLCSDGLSTLVSDEEIGRTVQDFPPEQAVRRLVSLANQRGAPDNVTVAVLRVLCPSRAWGSRLRRWGPLLAAICVLGLVGTALGVSEGGNRGVPVQVTPDVVVVESSGTPTTTETVVPTVEATHSPRVPVGLTGTINQRDGVWLRDAPSQDAAGTALLKRGQKVTIQDLVEGEVPSGQTGSDWYRVTVSSTSRAGFVYAEFVQLDSETSILSGRAEDR